jgi:cbb3-type cytochrome c oxidase subunit III
MQMTRQMTWIGLLATGLVVITFSIALLRESDRQEAEALEQRHKALIAATDLYAEYCVACHGASGEGLVANPPLNSVGIQEMDTETLFKTIERGRYNTSMAAFGVDESGVLSDYELDSLVTLLQYGSWIEVAARVKTLGLTPPDMVQVEVSEELLASVAALPDGDVLSLGLNIYAEHCAACHGANGEGTAVAPTLNTLDLLTRYTTSDLTRIVNQGVPGTIMAGWDAILSDDETAAVVEFLVRWDEVAQSGVVMPILKEELLDMSPEAIASGQQLYDLLCTQCHGVDAYGSPMAPALNNQQFLADTPDAAIQQIIAYGVPNTVMPAWTGYLTEADIAAITAFLRSLEATAPPMANQG